MTWPGIEPRSSGPLANTLPAKPMNYRKNDIEQQAIRNYLQTSLKTKQNFLHLLLLFAKIRNIPPTHNLFNFELMLPLL